MSANAPQEGSSIERRLARFLGWFSLALGVPQVSAPDRVNQLIGVKDDPESRTWQRVVGVRELVAWAGIVSRPRPVGWLWARVAGDLKDLALLAVAFRKRNEDTTRLKAATASVVGVTALDLVTAVRISRGDEQATQEDHAMHVKAAVTVRQPLGEVFAFWSDFENLPLFMDHLESVQPSANGHSHWKAKAPAGRAVEWDSEVVQATPNELIAWRSLPGSDVQHAGHVRFVPAPGGRGTEVHVEMDVSTPGGKLGEAIAKLFGEEPTQQVKDDLRRFKQVMETGEVVRSDASPEGITARRLLKQRPAQPPAEPVSAGGRTS